MSCQTLHNKRLRGITLILTVLVYCVYDAQGSPRPLPVVPCKQRIRGQSLLYGPSADTSAIFVDQARTAVSLGRIAKINTYISQDEGCITGMKSIYGSSLGAGQLLGLQQGMKEKSITLAVHEGVNRIDIKYDRRCIRYIRYYTNAGATETVGNSASPSSKLVAVIPQDSKWQLVSFRGTTINGTLQQVQFVWGEVFCAEIFTLSLAPPPTAGGSLPASASQTEPAGATAAASSSQPEPAAAAAPSSQPDPPAAAAAVELSPSPAVQSMPAASPPPSPQSEARPAAAEAVPAAAAAQASVVVAQAKAAPPEAAAMKSQQEQQPTSAVTSKFAAGLPATVAALSPPPAAAAAAPESRQAQQPTPAAASKPATVPPTAATSSTVLPAAANATVLPAAANATVLPRATNTTVLPRAANATVLPSTAPLVQPVPVAADTKELVSPHAQQAPLALATVPVHAKAAVHPESVNTQLPRHPGTAAQPPRQVAGAAQGHKQAQVAAAAAQTAAKTAAAAAEFPAHKAPVAVAAEAVVPPKQSAEVQKAAPEQQPEAQQQAGQQSVLTAAPAEAKSAAIEQTTTAAQTAEQQSGAAAAANVHTMAVEQQPADAQETTSQQSSSAAAAAAPADMQALLRTTAQKSAASILKTPAAGGVLPSQPSAVTLTAMPAAALTNLGTSVALLNHRGTVTVGNDNEAAGHAAAEQPTTLPAVSQGQQMPAKTSLKETPTVVPAAEAPAAIFTATQVSKIPGGKLSPAPPKHMAASPALSPSQAVAQQQPQQQQQGSSELPQAQLLPNFVSSLQHAAQAPSAAVAPSAAAAAAQHPLRLQQHEQVQQQAGQVLNMQQQLLHNALPLAKEQQQPLFQLWAPATNLSAQAATVAAAAQAQRAHRETVFSDLPFGEGCQDEPSGAISFVGSTKDRGRFVDHSLLMLNGPLQSISLYFSPSEGCLKGAKGVFGAPGGPLLAGMIGSSGGTKETVLRLAAGEVVTKVEYKADNAAFINNCIQHIRLHTNRGRSAAAGLASSPLPTEVAVAGTAQGDKAQHLVALKGVQDPNNGSRPGPLQQLQLVWGTRTCSTTTGSSSRLHDSAAQPLTLQQPGWYAYTPRSVAEGFAASNPGAAVAYQAVQSAVQAVPPVLPNARLSGPAIYDGTVATASLPDKGANVTSVQTASSTTGSTTGSLTGMIDNTIAPEQQLNKGSLPATQLLYTLDSNKQQLLLQQPQQPQQQLLQPQQQLLQPQQQLLQPQLQYSQLPAATQAAVQPLPRVAQSNANNVQGTASKPFCWLAMIPPTVVCNAQPESCNIQSQIGDQAYCAAVAPFTKSECVGGCCVSTGKCRSSSCSLSGLRTAVPNMMCYGLGGGFGYGPSGGSGLCQNLGCRLAVPGCLTGGHGGNCVGRVVALGPLSNPEGARFVGYPCLDVVPSDTTLNLTGASSDRGYYVARLWSVCDCNGKTTTQQGTIVTTNMNGAAPPSTGNSSEAPHALIDMFGSGAAQLQALLDSSAAAARTSGSSSNDNSGSSPGALAPSIINLTNVTSSTAAADVSNPMADVEFWMNMLGAGSTATGSATDLARGLSNMTANFVTPRSPGNSSASLSTTGGATEDASLASSAISPLGALGNLLAGFFQGGSSSSSGASLLRRFESLAEVNTTSESQALGISSFANQLLSTLTGGTSAAAMVPPAATPPPLPPPPSPLPSPQQTFSLEGLVNYFTSLQASAVPNTTMTRPSTTNRASTRSHEDAKVPDLSKVLPVHAGQGSSRGNSVPAAGLPPELAAVVAAEATAAAAQASPVSATATVGVPSNARTAAALIIGATGSSMHSSAVGTAQDMVGTADAAAPASLSVSAASGQQQQQQQGQLVDLLPNLLQALAAATNCSSSSSSSSSYGNTGATSAAPTPQVPGLVTSQQQLEQQDPRTGSPLSTVLQLLAASALLQSSPAPAPAAAATPAVVLPPPTVAAVDITPVGAPFDYDAMELPQPLAAAMAAHTANSALQPAQQLADQKPSTQQEARIAYAPAAAAPVAATSTSSRRDSNNRVHPSSSSSRDYRKGSLVKEPAVNQPGLHESVIHGALPDSISAVSTVPVAAVPRTEMYGRTPSLNVGADFGIQTNSSNSSSTVAANASALNSAISSRNSNGSSSASTAAAEVSAVDSAFGSASHVHTTQHAATQAVSARNTSSSTTGSSSINSGSSSTVADSASWSTQEDVSAAVSKAEAALAYSITVTNTSSSSSSSSSAERNRVIKGAGTRSSSTSDSSSSAHASSSTTTTTSGSNTTHSIDNSSSLSQRTQGHVSAGSSISKNVGSTLDTVGAGSSSSSSSSAVAHRSAPRAVEDSTSMSNDLNKGQVIAQPWLVAVADGVGLFAASNVDDEASQPQGNTANDDRRSTSDDGTVLPATNNVRNNTQPHGTAYTASGSSTSIDAEFELDAGVLDALSSSATVASAAVGSNNSTGMESTGNADNLPGVTAEYTKGVAAAAGGIARSDGSSSSSLEGGAKRRNATASSSTSGSSIRPAGAVSDITNSSTSSRESAASGATAAGGRTDGSNSSSKYSNSSSTGGYSPVTAPIPSAYSSTSISNTSSSRSSSNAVLISQHSATTVEVPHSWQVTPDAIFPVELGITGVVGGQMEAEHTGDSRAAVAGLASSAPAHVRGGSQPTGSRARRMLPKHGRRQGRR